MHTIYESYNCFAEKYFEDDKSVSKKASWLVTNNSANTHLCLTIYSVQSSLVHLPTAQLFIISAGSCHIILPSVTLFCVGALIYYNFIQYCHHINFELFYTNPG